jgi:hypothetical protein
VALFPQVPLPIFVDIAPGAAAGTSDITEWDPYWVDVTDDVRVSEGITIEQGRPDEASQVDPGTCKLMLDNQSGNYSPRNPTGAWYGTLAKNTPMRVRLLRLQDSFNRTTSGSWGTSDSGTSYGVIGGDSVMSTSPGTATITTPTANVSYLLNLAGSGMSGYVQATDVDVLYCMSVSALPTGGTFTNTFYVRVGTVNQSFNIFFRTDATIDVDIGGLGTANDVLTGYTANKKVWVRLRAYGQTFWAKAWYDGTTEPATWAIAGTNATTGPDTDGFGTGLWLGMFRTAGNSNVTSTALYAIEIQAPMFIGSVVEWPVRWDKSGNDSTVIVQAAGVLRRLQQGQAPLKSPLYQSLYGKNPIAYWPLEDVSGSTSAAAAGSLNPGPAMVYEAPFGWSSTTDPPLLGASSTAEITSNTAISGLIPKFTTTGWTLVMAVYTPALPPPLQDAEFLFVRTSGTGQTVKLSLANNFGGEFNARIYDKDGALLNSPGQAVFMTQGDWTLVQFEMFQSGANVKYYLRTVNLDSGANSPNLLGTFVGTLGLPQVFNVYGSATSYPTGSVGHIVFYNRGNGAAGVLDDQEMLASGRGYAGETSGDRVARLCAEQNIPVDVRDTTRGGELMGPQAEASILDVLRETEATDHGVLSEFLGGLQYRTRDRRYSQAIVGTINMATGGLAEPPEPTDDDQRLRNDWTVTRKNGSSARVTDEASIASLGRYDDSADINPQTDGVLRDHASFRVYLGTFDDLRWPSIELDCARNPTFQNFALALQVGRAFQISNPPSRLPVGTILAEIENIEHVLTPYGWDVKLTTSSYKPWRMPPIDDTDLVIDSDDSTLGALITSTATSMSVTHPAASVGWDTAVTSLGLLVGGEQMTVTAISGTGTTQTFTVTRSANAVVKAHAAGEVVRLLIPSYIAL